MRNKLKLLINRILGMRLGYRMVLLYIIGGLLPLTAISFYLIRGTNQILVSQAENAEVSELQTICGQILELQNTMTTVSSYFYFDEGLEWIANSHYTDYQQMVDDYKNYTGFKDYQSYYNTMISRISIFLENDSLRGNANFVVVDDAIRETEWYERVSGEGSGVVWAYLPHVIPGYDHAPALARMIKTKKGGDVGVLVIYLRPEKFESMIWEREGSTYILLNGGTVITSRHETVPFEELRQYLPEAGSGTYQARIRLSEGEYVLTCETVKQEDTKDYFQVVSVRAVDDILAEARRQQIKSLWLLGGSIVLAMSLIGAFSWSFSRRVGRFRAQMQKAAEGNFELEAKLGGNDEISQLYDYLSTMIYRIQRLLAEVYQEKIHAERLKTSQKDAEFKMLTSQINPHFLYNTLETIRMKARINKQYEIEELVKMLGKILRSSIQAGEKDMTIREEVELVEYYLKIQQYRFGERIQYQIYMEEGIEEQKILPLLIQPIAENCIIHGLEGSTRVGHIDICVKRCADDVLVTVTDDGSGIGEEKLEGIRRELKSSRTKGEHIGICNVNQRVRLRYGDAYGVTIESVQGEYTKVEIRLPAQPGE
ncbi:MAG: histidine kinase [Roseburia sp.]|nr:histidine kinase [Roseburia sp.]